MSASPNFCTRCGARVAGHFCPQCGASLAATPSRAGITAQLLVALCGATALLVLAFLAGDSAARRTPGSVKPLLAAGVVSSALTSAAVQQASDPSAIDISSMTPEQRASRLYDRVMWYSEQGKLDSARILAPMAIRATEMIVPVTAHSRYDIGMISALSGNFARARAEADTILAERPTHLLGLTLAARAARMQSDSLAMVRFSRRLLAAAQRERAAPLMEYLEHARDLDDALAKASLMN